MLRDREEGFWREACPRRDPGNTHAHWALCAPNKTHPGTDERHEWFQCCHCEAIDPTVTVREVERAADRAAFEMREAGLVESLADPDSLPLALEQPECDYRHNSIASTTLLIGDNGSEWRTCFGCKRQIEPKLATGVLSGAPWGIGRGWVSPRMQRRWTAISVRFAGRFG